jgi:hypothetical protein
VVAAALVGWAVVVVEAAVGRVDGGCTVVGAALVGRSLVTTTEGEVEGEGGSLVITIVALAEAAAEATGVGRTEPPDWPTGDDAAAP